MKTKGCWLAFVLVLALAAGCAHQKMTADPTVEAKAQPAPTVQYVPVPAEPLPAGTEALPLTAPHVLYLDVPAYPAGARETGLEGRVLVELLIDGLGEVKEATVTETTSTIFNSAAVAAARRCHFEPGKLGDQPIAFRWQVPFEFKLTRTEGESAGGTQPEKWAQPQEKNPSSQQPKDRPR
jgi:TonB family protein